MSRRNLIVLGFCFILALGAVITLYAATYKAVHTPNSFLRDYRKIESGIEAALDLKYNSYYIAGITNSHIYLGNITAPFRLLKVNHALTDTQQVQLSFKDTTNQWVYRKTMITIDSPYFYMADGVMPAIFRGKIGEWKAERMLYNTAYFTQLVPISGSSFAMRTHSYPSLDHVLGRLQLDSPAVSLNKDLLQKQVDGIFCTDGELHYNRDLKKLIYTYFYRNGYFVYDTCLNLEYRGHTIDTFSRAQIKVGYVNSDSTRMLTYKKFINPRTATNDNYLFVMSPLLAKNDAKNIMDDMTVYDVYDLRYNEYAFSFYLPKYRDKKPNKFAVYKNNVLFAISDQYLVKYGIRDTYF